MRDKQAALFGIGTTIWTLFAVWVGSNATINDFYPFGIWVSPFIGLIIYYNLRDGY